MEEEEKDGSVMRRVWNNKRRSSLYNLQDSVGLRYRKVDGSHGIKRQLLVQSSLCLGGEEENSGIQAQEFTPADSTCTSFKQNERITPEREASLSPGPVDSTDFGQGKRQSSRRETVVESSLSEDENCVAIVADNSDNEEELKKQAMAISECDRFFKQVKEEFIQSTGKQDQNETHTQLSRLHEEVKASGLFRRAMEEPEIVPHPLEESTQQAISRLQQNIQKCDQEMNGWKTLLERKQEELQTGEPSLLPEIDNAFLERHLTDEHWKLLQGTVDIDSLNDFLGRVEQQLNELNKSLDREVQAIASEKKNLEDKISVEQKKCMVYLLPMETPRALARDIKQFVLTSSDES